MGGIENEKVMIVGLFEAHDFGFDVALAGVEGGRELEKSLFARGGFGAGFGIREALFELVEIKF